MEKGQGWVWGQGTDIRLWFSMLPNRFLIDYNPGSDGETTYNDTSGAIQLGLQTLTGHVQRALHSLAVDGRLW